MLVRNIMFICYSLLVSTLFNIKARAKGILSQAEKQSLKQIKIAKPVVLFLTNYVSATDCANMTLAFGGSPIMADEQDEMQELVNVANALVLNIGTINQRTLNSMLVATKYANKKHIPVIFDPCGIGASVFRKQAVEKILKNQCIDVIKGNAGEIATLFDLLATQDEKQLCQSDAMSNRGTITAQQNKGVDNSFVGETSCLLKQATCLSNKLNCVLCITGRIDYVVFRNDIMSLKYGDASMSRITGTGCMLNGIIACFCSIFPKDYYSATCFACKIFGKKYYKLLKNKLTLAKVFDVI